MALRQRGQATLRCSDRRPLGSKADVRELSVHVRSVPEADIAMKPPWCLSAGACHPAGPRCLVSIRKRTPRTRSGWRLYRTLRTKTAEAPGRPRGQLKRCRTKANRSANPCTTRKHPNTPSVAALGHGKLERAHRRCRVPERLGHGTAPQSFASHSRAARQQRTRVLVGVHFWEASPASGVFCSIAVGAVPETALAAVVPTKANPVANRNRDASGAAHCVIRNIIMSPLTLLKTILSLREILASSLGLALWRLPQAGRNSEGRAFRLA